MKNCMSFSMECDTKIYTLFSELSSYTMNKTQQNAVEKHLSDPYNRIRYCYEFLREDDDVDMYQKTMRRVYHFLSTIEDTEYHY